MNEDQLRLRNATKILVECKSIKEMKEDGTTFVSIETISNLIDNFIKYNIAAEMKIIKLIFEKNGIDFDELVKREQE